MSASQFAPQRRRGRIHSRTLHIKNLSPDARLTGPEEMGMGVQPEAVPETVHESATVRLFVIITGRGAVVIEAGKRRCHGAPGLFVVVIAHGWGIYHPAGRLVQFWSPSCLPFLPSFLSFPSLFSVGGTAMRRPERPIEEGSARLHVES